MTKNGVSTVLRDSTMHSSILLKASANLSGGSNKFTFTPIGFSTVGTKASGTLGLCVKDLDGNNGIDVSSSAGRVNTVRRRSEEHTSELQSLMRISYAVFCLKQK